MSNPAELKYTAIPRVGQRPKPTAPSASASPTMPRRCWATSCSSKRRQWAARSKAGEECAVVESVKAAADVYAPVAGEVVAVNSELADAPEKINRIRTAHGCSAEAGQCRAWTPDGRRRLRGHCCDAEAR